MQAPLPDSDPFAASGAEAEAARPAASAPDEASANGLGGWLGNRLFTADPAQRPRLQQALLALLLMAGAVLALQVFAWTGHARPGALALWAWVTMTGMLMFFWLIRSGWSRRWRDPTLTVPQMVFGLSCGAAAYALVGAGRGAVFPVVMVILMLGMFVATPRQMAWISAYAVALFGLTMAALAWHDPQRHPVAIEAGHFLLVAVMMPAVSMLAARLARMRQRSRAHRADLAQALSRLRETNTRDELTGLVNQRQMQELMNQEHQRSIRSGQPFCLAVLDIDHFKPVNETHGYAVGDAVLRAVASESQRQVRACDTLSRWASDELVLLLSDARAALARGGLERLQQRVAALRILHGRHALSVTLSAGLAEHHAGEDVNQTLLRARQALREAKALGPQHLTIAP